MPMMSTSVPGPDLQAMREFYNKFENQYAFETHNGWPLKTCADWTEFKARVDALIRERDENAAEWQRALEHARAKLAAVKALVDAPRPGQPAQAFISEMRAILSPPPTPPAGRDQILIRTPAAISDAPSEIGGATRVAPSGGDSGHLANGSIKRRDTPERRAYWDFVEKTAHEVRENRPDWATPPEGER